MGQVQVFLHALFMLIICAVVIGIFVAISAASGTVVMILLLFVACWLIANKHLKDQHNNE